MRWTKLHLVALCAGASLMAAIAATATEVKTEPMKQAAALPNVLGCDWGNIHVDKNELDLTLYKQAGVDTVLLGLSFGWHGSARRFFPQKIAGQPCPNPTFWNGRDSYDREAVRGILNFVKQQHPTARIILWLQIDTYPEWITENPDEAVRNDKGEGFVVNFHFQRAGNDPNPAKGEVLAWSFYSQKLREDLRLAIKEFLKTVESAPGGDQVSDDSHGPFPSISHPPKIA